MYLFWKFLGIQHIKLVKNKLIYVKDQLNLESYIHTAIYSNGLKKTFKKKVTIVLQKKVLFPVQKKPTTKTKNKKGFLFQECLQEHWHENVS